ncbi:MAG TPA: UvrD-helicase domain-containing protein [Anaerolineales bacterium]|nr:UvrD-helicase domain-containing protein [Anaerolineales bacterium]
MTTLVDFFSLKDAQREAALARGVDVAVLAGAGSGKTRTLAARFITLLGELRRPRALAAITFTEKAAREMRNRIRAEIVAWRDGPCPPVERALWADLEAEIDTARIGTIHGLCAAILRAHPAEAEIDPRFSVLEEGDALRLRLEVADRAAQWASDRAELAPLFDAFGPSGLADVLSDLLADRLTAESVLTRPDVATAWQTNAAAQLRDFLVDPAVSDACAELRALAESGRLVADAGDKLAGQVRQLLQALGPAEAALAAKTLWPALIGLFAVRRACVGGAGLKTSRAKSAVRTIKEAYDRSLAPWLGGAKEADPPPDRGSDDAVSALLPLLAIAFTHAADGYRAEKDARQALDFDDLEDKALALLRIGVIRARWQAQIEALLVDEFQDTNARQREIVESLAGTYDGRRGRLFVVGDAKQSIYRFRGADVRVFRAMDRAIGARGGHSLALDRTYRAHPALVAGINDLGAAVLDGVPVGDSRVPFAPLQAGRAPVARVAGPYIRFVAGQGETSADGRAVAASALARELIGLNAQGIRWDEMALLFRASTGFPVYEGAFEAAGIPFVTVAGRGFYDRPEIRDVLNVLTAVADPWDDLALAGALRSPMFGLSDAALYTLRWSGEGEPRALWVALQQVPSALGTNMAGLARRASTVLSGLQGAVDRVPVAELLKRLLDETFYLATLTGVAGGSRLRRNLDKLLAEAHRSGWTRLSDFLETVQTWRDVGVREGEAPSDAGGAVCLLTVHKAKGLEFPVVVLADAGYSARHSGGPLLMDPQIGSALAPPRLETPSLAYRLALRETARHEQAEEARLLYVAATRAQEMLIVSGHVAKRGGETWLTRLGGSAGVNLQALAGEPGILRTATLPCGETITAVVEATVSIATAPAPERIAGPVEFEDGAGSLFGPITPPSGAPAEDPSDGDLRSHRATRRLAQLDGLVVGRLVHQALRRWRFPGDAGFENLMVAAARVERLIDTEQAGPHVTRAGLLLERLRADPGWVELNTAQRDGRLHHEVPYFLPGLGAGAIDLLYQDVSGGWGIVDFKTDVILEGESPEDQVRSGYHAQLRRYIDAVRILLNVVPTARLCWLDHHGNVIWETVGA